MTRPVYVTRNSPRLTLQGARLIMAAAARKAATIGVPMDIAVVDDGGHLLVFNRMDGAKLSSIDISVSKAWTAACARRATHEYAEIASPGKPAYGIHVSNSGRFMIVGGGLPICLRWHLTRLRVPAADHAGEQHVARAGRGGYGVSVDHRLNVEAFAPGHLVPPPSRLPRRRSIGRDARCY